MRALSPLLLSLLLAPASAHAGALYGTLRGERGPAAGVTLTVACPTFARSGVAPVSALTDSRGSFRLNVQANGRCEMRAQSGSVAGQPFSVFTSGNSMRYDVQVDRNMNRVQ